jgi:hypothetical protein
MNEPEPNPFNKAARLILGLIASGLVLIGGLDIVTEVLRWHIKGGGLGIFKIAINSLVILAGLGILATMGRLAEKLADYFDE